MNNLRKDNKVINNFLRDMSFQKTQAVTKGDFNGQLDKINVENSKKKDIIEDFVKELVEQCQTDHDHFNF